MTDRENELILQDRLDKIRSVIKEYGEENFYVSFSGGKDSTVVSALLDMAVPGNKIPRVFANTGIEYKLILDFIERERERASVGAGCTQAVRSNKSHVGERRVSVQKQGTFSGCGIFPEWKPEW